MVSWIRSQVVLLSALSGCKGGVEVIRAIRLMWLEFWIAFLREFNLALKQRRLRRQYQELLEEERHLSANNLYVPPEYVKKQRSREWN